MRFSEAFNIVRTDVDDWFDPDLSIDTPLFVDPIMLLQTSSYWSKAHEELVNHFCHCYPLVAKSASQTSNSAVVAQKLLTFPEPSEFCLGYTASGTAGAGSGRGFARSLADGIDAAICAGLSHPAHIEELGILNERFGADRISDATCNILKHRFIEYTQKTCRRHNVPMDIRRVRNVKVDLFVNRWISRDVLLPTNPLNGMPIILVPKCFLNDLPTLNADAWFDSSLNAEGYSAGSWRCSPAWTTCVPLDHLRAVGPLKCGWTTWFTKYGGPTERKWSNRTQVVQADRPRHDMRDAVPPCGTRSRGGAGAGAPEPPPASPGPPPTTGPPIPPRPTPPGAPGGDWPTTSRPTTIADAPRRARRRPGRAITTGPAPQRP